MLVSGAGVVIGPPEQFWDEVPVEADAADRNVTIVECRAPWREDFGPDWTWSPIARLRYVKTTGLWSLFWRDRHLKFHTYDRVRASANIQETLAEVDRDSTAILGAEQPGVSPSPPRRRW